MLCASEHAATRGTLSHRQCPVLHRSMDEATDLLVPAASVTERRDQRKNFMAGTHYKQGGRAGTSCEDCRRRRIRAATKGLPHDIHEATRSVRNEGRHADDLTWRPGRDYFSVQSFASLTAKQIRDTSRSSISSPDITSGRSKSCFVL